VEVVVEEEEAGEAGEAVVVQEAGEVEDQAGAMGEAGQAEVPARAPAHVLEDPQFQAMTDPKATADQTQVRLQLHHHSLPHNHLCLPLPARAHRLAPHHGLNNSQQENPEAPPHLEGKPRLQGTPVHPRRRQRLQQTHGPPTRGVRGLMIGITPHPVGRP
jgi:hypothetical protein